MGVALAFLQPRELGLDTTSLLLGSIKAGGPGGESCFALRGNGCRLLLTPKLLLCGGTGRPRGQRGPATRCLHSRTQLSQEEQGCPWQRKGLKPICFS